MKKLGRAWVCVCISFVALVALACKTQEERAAAANANVGGSASSKVSSDQLSKRPASLTARQIEAAAGGKDRALSTEGVGTGVKLGNAGIRALSGGAPNSGVSANLLANPGAEEPVVVAGQIPGWTAVSGSNWQPYAPQASDEAPAFEGGHYFYAGNVANGELRQDVDVSTYAALIDGESQAFLFQGFVRSYNQSPPDTSQIIVDYLNASKSTVLGSFDGGIVGSLLTWQHIVDQRLPPIGTRFIRVRLLPRRLMGNANDGYFDALSLQAIDPSPNLLQNGGAEGTNPIAGWTVVSGTWQGMTFASCGVSTCPQPYQGSRWFAPSTDPSAEMFQEASVASYSTTIDQGTQAFGFTGQLVSYNQTPADSARVIVEYRTDSGQVLASYDTGEVKQVSGWTTRANARLAPAGTRRIRVRLVSTRYGTGADNDGYYDGLSLRAVGPCSLAQVVDDGVQCTLDNCDALTGINHAPRPSGDSCSNFQACDGVETCNGAGACVAGPSQISDGNPCTVDSCNGAGAVTHTPVVAGTSCADADVCNGVEKCNATAVCLAGTPPVIDDRNPCTTDSCDPSAGVSHVVMAGASCGDGNVCNGQEICEADGSCRSPSAPQLDDHNPCTVDTCDPSLGVAHAAKPAGASCSDGDACNGSEVCSASGNCESGGAPQVSDGNPCTDDSCDAVAGVRHVARPVGVSCSDGDPCNGEETCSAQGACLAATTVNLSDGNSCTVDTCVNGVVAHAPIQDGASCSDGNLCTTSDTCQQGTCVAGNAVGVEDGNPCTSDSCDAATGLVDHQPVALGTSCDNATVCDGRETCNAHGDCEATAAPIVDDGNPCTTDSCDAIAGVHHVNVPSGTSCSDGNACNGVESCSAGACLSGAAPAVDDANPCSLDACDPTTGVVTHRFLPAGSSCPDQNLCNGAERCNAAGSCVPGTPATVDDGDACTIDSCDPLTGVRHEDAPSAGCLQRAAWKRLAISQPSPRDGAAGTFLGNGELLVFGGDNAGAVLNDLWLWNPASRTWRRAASGPAARAGASMAYDAQRDVAVLFGGVDSALPTGAYLNDVWEYHVATGTWQQRIADGAQPAGRTLASFAFDSTRGRAVLFGGTAAAAFADTWEWDAAQARWTQLGAVGPEARYGATFAFDAGRGVYALFGGSPGNSSGTFNDTWTLNAGSGVWQKLQPPQSPPARAGAVMAFDPTSSRFVMVGGTGVPTVPLQDTWELDAQGALWQQLALDETPSNATGAVLGFDAQAEQLTLAGGLSYSASGAFTPQSAAVWQLDRQAARWIDRTNRLAPTDLRAGAAFDSRAQAIVALGPLPPPDRPLMWSFDPRSPEWRAKDITDVDHPFSDGEFEGPTSGTGALFYSAPLSRLIAAATGRLLEWDGTSWSKRCDLVADGKSLKLFSATSAFDSAAQQLYQYRGRAPVPGLFAEAKLFKIDVVTCSSATLHTTGEYPAPRDDATSVWDSTRGRLILFGGLGYQATGDPVYAAETWEFDPASMQWLQLAGVSPPARHKASAIYDPSRRRVLLHGGRNQAGQLQDTWEFDPETHLWSELATTGPSSGEDSAVVFDEVRQTPALVSTRGSVWHLISGKWVADLNGVSPSARSGMSGGWSPVSGLGLFFGGTSGDGQRDFLGDLWLWKDGWRGAYPGIEGSTLLASGQGEGDKSNQVPAARTGHVLATGLVWQSSHVPLLFGGEGASGQFFGLFGDTWTFSEETMEWRAWRTSATTPRGRTGHAISVVPSIGYLMFGGLSRNQVSISGDVKEQRDFYLGETWLWRPVAGNELIWRKVTTSDAPSPRYGHAMVTDESANQIVLFGGRTESGVSDETWVLSLNGLGSTASWRKLTPPTAPLPRFGHSMTYDPVRQRVVLTGGEGTSAGQDFGDTWEWDSESERWSARNVQPLEARVGHVTFFDPTRGELVAFGGFRHSDNGQFALTYADTLVFQHPEVADPLGGLTNGSRCMAAAECASGNCVDGFCCNSVCADQCGACDVAGAQGTCKAVKGAPHGARTSCSADSTACANQCDGGDLAACHLPGAATTCGPPLGCAGENLVTATGACDGAGACAQSQVSCLPYGCCPNCAPVSCHTNCSSGSDNACATGYKCNGSGSSPFGVCYKATRITNFTADPPNPRVGVPVTLRAAATEPASDFGYFWRIGNNLNTTMPCSSGSCVWTPTADQVGQQVIWTLRADAAPAVRNLNDDTATLTLTVGP